MTNARLTIGLIQPTSTTSVERNAALSEPMIREAAAKGAQLISLPEVVNLVDIRKGRSMQEARTEADDPCLALYRALAKELGVWIHVGSLALRLEDEDRMANRAFMIDDKGEIRARYDKIHMFDVDLDGGESYRESKLFRPGEKAVLVDSPWGKIGLAICYDLRFPHLHRTLAENGARIILNPAAFTRKTGQAHWHTLLTARAIETTCFVAAAAQCGDHEDGRETYGHSLVVAPWGEVIADGGETPGIVITELDLGEVDKVRGMVPSLSNGRPFTLEEK
ncbi:carbon-nitrogen hydrolase family protein [Aestuariispira insulae]|uniref:CN hydrolase domain-containing protein n=1 Tax=Aestuariispira insulae TaxID=1461337 RepID=A0A3D9HDV3_9PROT|nr:carbon-nitrogen hydrolase family protein [Aestuariispira insulae]RED47653.1 hypothetical protein DFP90_10917 [Aestuariispira insulae]